MIEKTLFILLLTLFILSLTPAQSVLQTKYSAPANISELDFRLLKFNMWWHDSFKPPGDYANSSPAYYRKDLDVIYCAIRISEKRIYDDSEPFTSLTPWNQKGVLEEVANHFKELLSANIPELNDDPSIYLLEFFILYPSGVKARVASYKNGQLELYK